ncbi:uncharacterized protein Z518_05322 [Rhinocladiella mackenziei CBS 650.93]|uniref:Dynamin-type G domain-containing protein n=1 Tax=Rhinocladiella mackenziei CBS 650.93 TaxID=1442369 RepID=A0A0D2IF66_9EURO|nr:uncharacterized protein Z518_05322 [Rhinocladiella mackenziei CBS 650.93]KIX04454.1 hypothetical protein Z518_05322 [Rhinocladiella mackenziei CBS 650.93]
MAYHSDFEASTPEVSQTPSMNGYVNVPKPPTDRLGGLQSPEEKRLFELVDKLKDLDVEHELNLPQLVVCGSQSSGKSSVLEAISGLQFPRGELTCTKFVTELRFRSGNVESIDVEIVPDTGRSPDEQARLRNVRFRSRRLTELASMVKDAEKIFGLNGRSGFVRDVLRLTIIRPNQQPLTIIDTPGLIASHNEGREHIELVNQIVGGWIKQPLSLILAVVEASLDAQKQSVLTTAKEVDSKGERTFGIITKPDVVEPGSQLEAYWIEKARNFPGSDHEFKFEKGWHVLRNRGVRETGIETSAAERDEVERQFFLNRQRRWSKINEAFWGIDPLQGRLRSIYYEHTKSQLPRIRDDIEARLQRSTKDLDDIKARLVEPEKMWAQYCDQRTGLAVRAKDRADGTYLDEGAADWSRSEYYLRSRIEEDHDEFAHIMVANGHHLRQERSSQSLTDDAEQFRVYVQQMLESTRGHELRGNYNPQRLNILFREHSSRWYHIAKVHIGRTYQRCINFVNYIIDNDLGDSIPSLPVKVSEAMKDHLKKSLEKQKEKAEDELNELEQDRKQPAKTQSERFEILSRRYKSAQVFAHANRLADAEERSAETIKDGSAATSARFTPAHVDRTLAQDPRAAAAAEMGERMVIYYKARFIRHFSYHSLVGHGS